MDFLDRVEEQKRFKRFLNLREGALACVYGRRRIGKSRLIEEVVAASISRVSWAGVGAFGSR